MGRYEAAPDKGFIQRTIEAWFPSLASNATSTQQRYPWRAVIRTWFQFIVAVAAAAPIIYEAIMQESATLATGGALTALTVAGAITRLMTLPLVDELLKKFAPFLASEPKA